MPKQKLIYAVLLFSLLVPFLPVSPAKAQLSTIRPIVFPVIGKVSYYDDFGAPRVGHTHEGNDLMGKKLMPLVAAVDGTVDYVNYPEATWGYSVGLRDADGYHYNYLHINNDNPGTDDDKGGGFFAYAPDIVPGAKVVKGQLIGWMGDSGDAETTSPHLHFEIRMPDDTAFSPYQSLQAAAHITTPVTDYPKVGKEILPYGDFRGGMTVAVGNLDSDSADELVTGAGPSGGPLVRSFKKDGTPVAAFYAYDPSFRGGVDVAVGDTDGDGKSEIITAPGVGGGPHIKVYKADGVTVVSQFMAYDPKFHGGVNVTTADLDGDGKAEIITAPMAGGGPDIRVFKPDGTLIKEFMAYDPKFHGGVDVAAVSKKGNTAAAIVTAPAQGGGPDIRVFDSSAVMSKEFMAYDGNYFLGVRVSVGNIVAGNAPQITVMPGSGGGPNLKVFGLDGTLVSSQFVGFEQWWHGGYDVAAGNGETYVASGASTNGGRRASLRAVSGFNNFGN